MLESKSLCRDLMSWLCEPRAIAPILMAPILMAPILMAPILIDPILMAPIFVEATAAFGLTLTDPDPFCWATVGRLPLLSRRTVPIPAGVMVDDGFDVAVALSVTDERDAGAATVALSEAIAGSPSSEETVIVLSNGVPPVS